MNEPDLLDITIIRARAGLDALHRIAARHEFEAILEPVSLSPWECVHWFGENILYWRQCPVAREPRPGMNVGGA